MKKRLLITSIVMMLVVAVALSTATYAWFTSNNTVNATSVTMVASVSDTAALSIGWVPTAANTDTLYGSQISTTAIGNDVVFAPVAPTTVTANTTAIDAFTFGSAHIRTLSNRNYFTDVVDATAAESNNNVYKWSGTAADNASSTIISIKNSSTVTTTRNITVTATFADDEYQLTQDSALVPGKTYYTQSVSGENTTYSAVASPVVGSISTYYEKITDNSLIRIAIFKNDGTSFKLIGIMAQAASTIAWGTIAEPSNAATPSEYETAEVKMHISGKTDSTTDVVTTSATLASSGLPLGTLNPTADMQIKVVVWMDGQALGDNQGGLKSTISLTFTEDAQ